MKFKNKSPTPERLGELPILDNKIAKRKAKNLNRRRTVVIGSELKDLQDKISGLKGTKDINSLNLYEA